MRQPQELGAETPVSSPTAAASLDVLPSGVRSWIYRYRSKAGIRFKLTIARYPDLSLRAARGKRDKLAGEVARGMSPAHDLKEQKREQKEREQGRGSDPTPGTVRRSLVSRTSAATEGPESSPQFQTSARRPRQSDPSRLRRLAIPCVSSVFLCSTSGNQRKADASMHSRIGTR